MTAPKPRWTYTAHAYRNHGCSFTGWVKADNGRCSFTHIRRAGYSTMEEAMGYAERRAKAANETEAKRVLVTEIVKKGVRRRLTKPSARRGRKGMKL